MCQALGPGIFTALQTGWKRGGAGCLWELCLHPWAVQGCGGGQVQHAVLTTGSLLAPQDPADLAAGTAILLQRV